MTPSKQRQKIRDRQKVALAEALYHKIIPLKRFNERMKEIQKDIEDYSFLASYKGKMKRLKEQFN